MREVIENRFGPEITNAMKMYQQKKRNRRTTIQRKTRNHACEQYKNKKKKKYNMHQKSKKCKS